ncbi:MAG: thermonuclease family protein [Alphaproteobacteria bacterium]
MRQDRESNASLRAPTGDRRAVLRLLALGAAWTSALPLQAAFAKGKPDRLAEAAIKEVIDGDTVMVDNGDQVRLVGLQAPRLPLDRPGVKAWPLAAESKAALERIALGKLARFEYTGRPRDRYRRHLAHLFVGDLWIQGEMAKAGWARVYGFADNRARLRELLAFEGEARAARRG